LYAFDFDGTLAPIVNIPEKAKASIIIDGLLRELSAHESVAVISGRSIADLKKRMDFVPDHLIGNHGLEGLSLRAESANQAQSICNIWKKQLGKAWNLNSGVFLEDKTYSLAIHYRNSRNKKSDRLALFKKIEKLDPSPRVVLGKCVFNLIPPGAPHKGVALLELMMRLDLKCALYIGDDDTDEDVFSLPDARIISVRVGQKSSSQAQYFIKRQNEVSRMLRNILKLVKKCQKNR